MYLDPRRGAKEVGVGVPLEQPLRVFSHHPLEGAGFAERNDWNSRTHGTTRFFEISPWSRCKPRICEPFLGPSILCLVNFFKSLNLTIRIFSKFGCGLKRFRPSPVHSNTFWIQNMTLMLSKKLIPIRIWGVHWACFLGSFVAREVSWKRWSNLLNPFLGPGLEHLHSWSRELREYLAIWL